MVFYTVSLQEISHLGGTKMFFWMWLSRETFRDTFHNAFHNIREDSVTYLPTLILPQPCNETLSDVCNSFAFILDSYSSVAMRKFKKLVYLLQWIFCESALCWFDHNGCERTRDWNTSWKKIIKMLLRTDLSKTLLTTFKAWACLRITLTRMTETSGSLSSCRSYQDNRLNTHSFLSSAKMIMDLFLYSTDLKSTNQFYQRFL